MKRALVLTSTFPRWKNDSTASFVKTLSEKLSNFYKIIILAPHHKNARSFERENNTTIRRFKYFFPERLQKIAYNEGIIPNIKKSTLAKLQIPLFILSESLNAGIIPLIKKINLIHAHWIIPQGIIGFFLKKIYRIPLITTIHGSGLVPLKNIFFKKIQKIVIKNSDIITVNSMNIKLELINRFPESKKQIDRKVHIIPMGIDTNLFKKINIDKKFRKYKNNKILLFIGRLNKQKGVHILIKSLPYIIKNNNNIKLLIIGEGEYKKTLEALINKLRLQKFVELLGPKPHEELVNYYNLADIFILPSITTKIGTEAFGLVLVEAMACKTCVIGSSSGGIKNIISHEKNGLIFKEKSPEDLAEKINLTLSNHAFRLKLAQKGYEFSQKLDWKEISKQFNQIYSKLIQ